jgi:hypothetical protein
MPHYKARYIPLKQGDTEAKPYYRTITSADTLNDAMRQAERLCRKGYICHLVTEMV